MLDGPGVLELLFGDLVHELEFLDPGLLFFLVLVIEFVDFGVVWGRFPDVLIH